MVTTASAEILFFNTVCYCRYVKPTITVSKIETKQNHNSEDFREIWYLGSMVTVVISVRAHRFNITVIKSTLRDGKGTGTNGDGVFF